MTICAVCHRGLSNPRSVSRGTGPVCDRNVNEFIQLTMVSDMAARARDSWARMNGRMLGVRDQAIRTARARFLSRIHTHSREIPVETGSIDLGDADPRRRSTSEITFERFDSGAVMAHSGSDEDYLVVTDEGGRHALGCSCPSFAFHRGRAAGSPCRHMDAYDALADARRGSASAQEAVSARNRATSDAPVPSQHRIEQAPAILSRIVDEEVGIEAERDASIQAWHERHRHDGVLMSEDNAAWERLYDEAKANIGQFEHESVLDGSGNTFGIELEVEFADNASRDAVLLELRRAGITSTSGVTRYHSRLHNTLWTPQHDGSLRNGVEFISPVLRDNPEEWQRIEHLMHILNQHGNLRTSNTNGMHIHVGNQPLDDRGYRWQRLARYAHGYSNQYYRMGGARRSDGREGGHRGSRYAEPMNARNLKRISKSDTALVASQKMIGADRGFRGNRYHMISTAKMVNNQVPTVEFRYPNATYDANVLQRQVQLANLTMQQSAYLRKRMPGADRLPKLFSHDEGISLSDNHEMRFRQYLDTLGSDRLRKIATQLWIRGASPNESR